MKKVIIAALSVFLFGCQGDQSLNLSKEETFSEVGVLGQEIYKTKTTEESLKVEKRYRSLIKKIHKDKLLVGMKVSEVQKIFSDWKKCDPKLHRKENGELCVMQVIFFYDAEVLEIFADDKEVIIYTGIKGT